MRLLVDCMPLRSGGGVQCAVALLQGLQAQNAISWCAIVPDVMVSAAPETLSAAAASSSNIVVLPKHKASDLWRAGRSLARIERSFGADIVFTVFGPAYFKATAPHLVGFALGNLVAGNPGSRSTMKSRLADAVRRMLVRRADHLVVEAEAVRSKLTTRLGIAPDHVSVIGNAVNPILERYPAIPRPIDGGFRILVPSAYYPHKNLEVIPSVAAALDRSMPTLPFSFHLTLDATSDHWRALHGAAEAAGVGDRLVALGSLPMGRLADAYRDAAMVFLPTLCESSTAVYPEAFHFHRPLVTSDLDFARELCGEAALFVPPLDAEAIARAIASIATDPAVGDRLIAAGTAQLASGYPTPACKLEMQLDLLNRLAGTSLPSPFQGRSHVL